MWISKNKDWDINHTDLTKYFFEKVKQLVDYEEIISNRHRTTNGFTLISEILNVAEQTYRRKKSLNRLISVISESVDKSLSSNIINDYILNSYHNDIIQYYQSLNSKKTSIEENLINDIIIKSKIIILRLEKDYFSNIIAELHKIDFASDQFERNAKTIDSIVDILIPFILFKGYSTTSISDIAYRFIRKKYGINGPIKFLEHFKNKLVEYDFLIIVKQGYDEFNAICCYLDYKNIDYSSVNVDNFKSLKKREGLIINSDQQIYEFKHKTLDPHNFIRNLYDRSLKDHVSKKDRLSLVFFNDYFENVYWRFSKGSLMYQPCNIKVDPINIKQRKNTLLDTLKMLCPENGFEIGIFLPIINEIRDSIYYYNLALGSKSLENSISLLWTSLESLIPYRLYSSDIENVKHFVSKSIAIGSIGRDISSFAFRYIEASSLNKIDVNEIGIESSLFFTPEGFTIWAEWLSKSSFTLPQHDPYTILKPISNLLCKQYCNLNNLYSGKNGLKVQDIIERITSSKKSIEYQLDRIYLHRNQIVHSGKVLNEYSNLWTHLEWYIGKILSYCYLKYFQNSQGCLDAEKIFMELEGYYDSTIAFLNSNKDKSMIDIRTRYGSLFEQSWQYF
jgi:hypothetical protein